MTADLSQIQTDLESLPLQVESFDPSLGTAPVGGVFGYKAYNQILKKAIEHVAQNVEQLIVKGMDIEQDVIPVHEIGQAAPMNLDGPTYLTGTLVMQGIEVHIRVQKGAPPWPQ